MMLDAHLRSLGNKLFRWRSWTPLLAAGLLYLERDHFYYPFGSHAADVMFELGCLGVALAGTWASPAEGGGKSPSSARGAGLLECFWRNDPAVALRWSVRAFALIRGC